MSNVKLSNNFTLSGYTKSQTAIRNGIVNKISPEHFENAKALFENVAQQVRDQFGVTIITSGYRNPELNKLVKGSASSQHCKGEAVDIEVPGHSNFKIAKWISENTVFDQLILEFYIEGVPDSGWVHVSFKKDGTNRGQVLTASRVKQPGGKQKYKTVYKIGLHE
jgi:hypothetical protein